MDARTPKTRETGCNRPRERSHVRSDESRALGAQGEARAARFLVKRGYRIVERNVRLGGVEVDLIASRGRVIAFVEVKTRRTDRFGPPEMAVDSSKQSRLVRAAASWLHQQRGLVREVRFDVIACRPPAGALGLWRIEHLPGAFDAGD